MHYHITSCGGKKPKQSAQGHIMYEPTFCHHDYCVGLLISLANHGPQVIKSLKLTKEQKNVYIHIKYAGLAEWLKVFST